MSKWIKYIIPGLMLVATLNVQAQQERKYIRRGNREYLKATADSAHIDSSRFQKAEVDYRRALDEDPNNWDASYDLANSLYRQKKFDEANRQYEAVASLDNKNKDQVAMAYHNLGNSLLQSNKLQEAIEAYKNALRRNPSDMATKYNLAWAQDKLKKQQQQQQNQDKDQDKKNDQQNKQDQQQQQNQQDKQDQQQKQDQQKQQQQDQQQKQDQQQQNQAQQQKDQISKEDAARILEALQNDEKDVQQKVQQQKVKAVKVKIEKDW